MKALDSARGRLLLGYAAALGAAAGYGASALIARKAVTEYAPPMVTAAFSILFGTALTYALFFSHVTSDARRAPRRAWGFLVLAGFFAALGVGLQFMALSRGSVVLVQPLAATAPLVTLVLSHIFLQRLERVTWRTVAGAGLVVAGVALVAAGRR